MTSKLFEEDKAVESRKENGNKKGEECGAKRKREANLFIGWKAVYKCEIANTYEISGVRGKKG